MNGRSRKDNKKYFRRSSLSSRYVKSGLVSKAFEPDWKKTAYTMYMKMYFIEEGFYYFFLDNLNIYLIPFPLLTIPS